MNKRDVAKFLAASFIAGALYQTERTTFGTNWLGTAADIGGVVAIGYLVLS